MKKLFSLVLAVAMVLSMACFASAEENTTLTIVAWDVGTTPYYQAQKEAFEATHPGVTIEYVDVASQDWDTKAGTMLSGGDTSDLFMVKQNINIMNWAQQGFAEPLTDYIAKDNYDLSGFVGMEPNYALDGTQYALPFRSDFWVLFYNKTLFDAAGVAYPTNDMTWEEYAALAKEMTGKGNCKYGCHYHTWLSAIVNFAVDDGVNTLLDGEYSDLKYFYDLALSLEDADACHVLRTFADVGRGYDELLKQVEHRAGRYAAELEKNINADGSYPVIGRSITYRFGAFQLLSQAALEDFLPNELPPEQVRTALTACIRKVTEHPAMFDAQGWLQPGVYGCQPDLAEEYICVGSLYLCLTVFLPLGLAPTADFWSKPEIPWTAKRIWSGENVMLDHAVD